MDNYEKWLEERIENAKKESEKKENICNYYELCTEMETYQHALFTYRKMKKKGEI